MTRTAGRLATFVLAALAFFTLASSASATVATPTASHIDAPADHTYYNDNEDGTATTIDVSGTTTGEMSGDTVDLDCYFTTPKSGLQETTLKAGVTVDSTTHTFSATNVPLTKLVGENCRLRAVPAGFGTSADPSAYTGPGVAVSGFHANKVALAGQIFLSSDVIADGPNKGIRVDYALFGAQFTGDIQTNSPGSCGPNMFASDSNFDVGLFGGSGVIGGDGYVFCGSELFGNFGQGDRTRSDIVVDGQNAYDAAGAAFLFERSAKTTFDGSFDNPGLPQTTVSESFDPATGNTRIDQVSPLVRCPTNVFNPHNQSQCPSFQPTGVSLERITTTGRDGVSATSTDTVSGTDGKPHGVELIEETDLNTTTTAWQLPGETGFHTHPSVETDPSSPAPASIFGVSNPASTDGSLTDSRAAITFSRSYATAQFDDTVFGGTERTLFLDYPLLVPAGGVATVSLTHSNAFHLSDAQAGAAAAQALYAPPSVAISSPANGSTSNATPATISGTVSASQPLQQVVVNGVVATLGPGGTWSAQVPLSLGSNAVTAVASTIYGATSQAQETVNFAIPPLPSSPGASLSLSGAIKQILNGVRFQLACLFATCHGSAVLTTVEKVKGGKVISARRQKIKKRTVVVGRVNFTISAGQTKTITLTLNATGRRLLKRFGKLPVTFKVTLIGADGKPIVIKSKKLTLKPQKKHKKKKH